MSSSHQIEERSKADVQQSVEFLRLVYSIKKDLDDHCSLRKLDIDKLDDVISFLIEHNPQNSLPSRAKDTGNVHVGDQYKQTIDLISRIFEICKRLLDSDNQLDRKFQSNDKIFALNIIHKYCNFILETCEYLVKNITTFEWSLQVTKIALLALEKVCYFYDDCYKIRIIRTIIINIYCIRVKYERSLFEKLPNPHFTSKLSINRNNQLDRDDVGLLAKSILLKLCNHGEENLMKKILNESFEFVKADAIAEVQSAALDIINDIRSNFEHTTILNDDILDIIYIKLKSEHPSVRSHACECLREEDLINRFKFKNRVCNLLTNDPELMVRVSAQNLLVNIPKNLAIQTSIKHLVRDLITCFYYLKGNDEVYEVVLLEWIRFVIYSHPIEAKMMITESDVKHLIEYFVGSNEVSNNQAGAFVSLNLISLIVKDETKNIKILHQKSKLIDKILKRPILQPVFSDSIYEYIILYLLKFVFEKNPISCNDDTWLIALDLMLNVTDHTTWGCIELMKQIFNLMQNSVSSNTESLFSRHFDSKIAILLMKIVAKEPDKDAATKALFNITNFIINSNEVNYSWEARACAAKLMEITLIDYNMTCIESVLTVLMREFKLVKVVSESGKDLTLDSCEVGRRRFRAQLVQIVLASFYAEPNETLKDILIIERKKGIDDMTKAFLEKILEEPIDSDIFCPGHETKILIHGLCQLITTVSVSLRDIFEHIGPKFMPRILSQLEMHAKLFEDSLRASSSDNEIAPAEYDYLNWSKFGESRFKSKTLDMTSDLKNSIKMLLDTRNQVQNEDLLASDILNSQLSYLQRRFLAHLDSYINDIKEPQNGIESLIRSLKRLRL